MGPGGKMPVLPRYDVFEDLPPEQKIFTDGNCFGSMRADTVVDFNWFQHYENIHDMGHAFWLHQFHSGPQFGDAFEALPRAALPMITALVKYERSERGALSRTVVPHPNGDVETRIIETVPPTLRLVPAQARGKLDHISCVLPIDETHYRIFTVSTTADVLKFNTEMLKYRASFTPEWVQRHPGDYEAQGGQGDITFHSEEHLAGSDRGVVLLRRVLEQQVDIVAAGGDPLNVIRSAGSVVQTVAGIWFQPTAAPAQDGSEATAT